MATMEDTDSSEPSAKEVILKKVAESDGFFKSQQRGEPDLLYLEKYEIADKLLDDKPSTFLSRYGKFLSDDDLKFFDSMKDNFMVDFHLKELKQMSDDKKNKMKVRNRRYEAMKELMDKGEYFSDDEMKQRDPLLYEQMVGQYLSDDEINTMVDKSDLRFSSILTKHMDVLQSNIIYGLQKEIMESQMEEEDEDDESEENEEGEEEEEEMEEDEEKKPAISPEEKTLLRAEFLRTMQLKFLDGEPDYDYSEIDGNVAYDSLDIRERDEQEQYFDEEDNESKVSSKSSSTGDLTFLTPSQFKTMKRLSDKMSPLALGDSTQGSSVSKDSECNGDFRDNGSATQQDVGEGGSSNTMSSS